jgi:hypothetical protein
VYDSKIDARCQGRQMSASLSELRRVFETATANIDKVSFTITALPTTPEDLIAMLSVARAVGRHSGAALRRVELPARTARSFGSSFHDVAISDAQDADVLRLFFAREGAELDSAA